MLAADNLTFTLLDGAGGGVILAAATASWRLYHGRQDRRLSKRQMETDEVKALRTIVDGVMEFLVGRSGVEGLPDAPGFIRTFEDFQGEVRTGLADLHDAVEMLAAEWRPNGGESSYDRLRSLHDRGGSDASQP